MDNLSLHIECRRRLTSIIADAISRAEVRNGAFLELEAFDRLLEADKTLPEKALGFLTSIVGDSPLFTFVFHTIAKAIAEAGEFSDDTETVALTDFELYRDSQQAAETLVAQLLTLPWKYSISVELNSRLSEAVREVINVGSNNSGLRLVVPDREFNAKYPVRSVIKNRDASLLRTGGLLAARADFEWNESAVYLQWELSGFLSDYKNTESYQHVESTVKAFHGLGLATGTFLYESTESRPPPITLLARTRPLADHRAIVHRWTEAGFELWTGYQLSQDLADSVDSVRLREFEGDDSNEGQFKDFLWRNLEMVRAAFNGLECSRSSVKAGEWLFDSYCGSNELLSFLQAAVAMEIVLGDEEEQSLGLGALLANRCAYLIGRTQSERDFVLKEFKEIYKVRSKIVHTGLNRLSGSDRKRLTALRVLSQRVIHEELLGVVRETGMHRQ